MNLQGRLVDITKIKILPRDSILIFDVSTLCIMRVDSYVL